MGKEDKKKSTDKKKMGTGDGITCTAIYYPFIVNGKIKTYRTGISPAYTNTRRW